MKINKIMPAFILTLTLFACRSQGLIAHPSSQSLAQHDSRAESSHQVESSQTIPIDDDFELEIISPQEKLERELIPLLPDGVSASDWQLRLVNRDHPLPQELDLNLVDVGHGQMMDVRVKAALQAWFDQAEAAGHPMQLVSGYRSFDQQGANYHRRIEEEKNQGHDADQAKMMTEQYIMPAGASEHHTGLAIDLVSVAYINQGGLLDPGFANQPAYDYYISTMADYGFIIRYLEGKEHVTGINFEPWHFRFVGRENAKFMTDHYLTLEEYVHLLQTRDSQQAESESNG